MSKRTHIIFFNIMPLLFIIPYHAFLYPPSSFQQIHINYIRIYQFPSQPRAFKIPSSLWPKKLPIYGFSFFNVASLKFNDLYPNVYVFFLCTYTSAFIGFCIYSLSLPSCIILSHTCTHIHSLSFFSHFFAFSLASCVT